MQPANERRRYIVMSSLIGRAHTQIDPCNVAEFLKTFSAFLNDLTLWMKDNEKSW